ncbi:SDR family NAD(P)-dependent oxidoreductase [Daejeonella oryzae]|uniref:SDR family NAD(P)-dependent oxidoreductase n=1 Tax=Daejeonella oryzae TaxID=1122943 RepID=UPI0004003170|nr:SDR family oxidoreductase [Daejeonella oryzae]
MNAIVTGATKGIGRAVSLQLAANNYNLALCSRNSTDLERFKKEILELYPAINILTFKADFEIEAEVQAFAQYVASGFSFTDVLVNNAGLFIPSALLDEDDSALERQMQINVKAPQILSKFFGRKMREEGKGHIFNICSVASINPAENAGSYSVTKFALLGLTRVLRMELMKYGVKVTAILPGSTLTSSWEGTSIPAERFVDPEDVASALINSLKMSAGANTDEIVITPSRGDV